MFRTIPVLLLCLLLSSCGGGGSDSGIVLEGTLLEMGGAGHRALSLKHSVGEPIGEVEICALSKCSITDSEGQWGFLVDSAAGEILFTIRGHGIDTSSVINVGNPGENGTVSMELQHVEGGKVIAHVHGVDDDHDAGDDHGEDNHDDDHAHEEEGHEHA